MRVENDHCDMIGVSVAPTELDNLSSAILQQGGWRECRCQAMW